MSSLNYILSVNMSSSPKRLARYVYFFIVFLLAVSSSTAFANLLNKGAPLNETEFNIASSIAKAAAVQCNNQPINYEDSNLASYLKVNKLYRSDGGWFFAQLLIDGVWDKAYFNSITGDFVCGYKNWLLKEEHSKIIFQDALGHSINPQQMLRKQRIYLPGVVGPNERPLRFTPDPDPRVFNVIADGPEVSESGCVTPVSLNFIPPIPSGKSFDLLVNGLNVANIFVNRGFLYGFSYRAIMYSSGDVSAVCEGCSVTRAFINVTKACDKLSEQTVGNGTSRVRTNDFEFKTLISGSYPNGKISMTGQAIEITITPTIYTVLNPYIGIKTEPPFTGEGCVTVSPSNNSFSRKSCGIN